MEQKTTWMRYLQLVLIINIIFLLNSCVDKEFSVRHDYFFVNETNFSISYQTGLEKFNVAPNAITKYTTSIEVYDGNSNGDYAQPEIFSPISAFRGDSIINIKFNNIKCLNDIKKESPNSVLNIKNYSVKKTDETKYNISYNYTYTFTEADYNRAVTCP